MKATELRIGNLVQANGVYEGSVKTFERFNDDLTVAFFSDGSPHGIGEFLKDCGPIPLTEDWLLRFGAVAQSRRAKHGVRDTDYDYDERRTDLIFDSYTIQHYWRSDSVNKEYGKEEHRLLLFVEGGNYDNCVVELDHINHVHQLQNLYHSLTGEELELK